VSIRISRLEKALHVRATLSCGDLALDEYLKGHAWQNQQRHLVGTTYVAVDESQPQVVVGYYTLAMTEISCKSIPGLTGLPYSEIPAILLARLAVDLRFGRRGLGRQLLAEAFERALNMGLQVGCRCLIVDAYPTAVTWYQRFGLLKIEGGASSSRTTRMFIDLRTVAKAKRAAVASVGVAPPEEERSEGKLAGKEELDHPGPHEK
jgi:GNAT superfamily N-acetyltransferase